MATMLNCDAGGPDCTHAFYYSDASCTDFVYGSILLADGNCNESPLSQQTYKVGKGPGDTSAFNM